MIYILSQKEYEGASNLPCIEFEYKDVSIDLKDYDALIFSSKNGVLAYERLGVVYKDIPIYSIGSATSKALSKDANLVYEAKNSYGDDFADEIKERLSGKKALFLRAKVVTSKLNKILKDAGVLLDELVVYETKCADCDSLKKPPKNSIIIFSSPSTIECFFRCFSWDESYKAVVIGKVTAKYMPKEIDFHLSKKQSIPSCVELAKTL
jgi:uroporphyrinogen-III synthase